LAVQQFGLVFAQIGQFSIISLEVFPLMVVMVPPHMSHVCFVPTVV
jgi:hypothetical protein